MTNFCYFLGFLLQSVGGAKVVNDQVMITDVISCSEGYMVIGDTCGKAINNLWYIYQNLVSCCLSSVFIKKDNSHSVSLFLVQCSMGSFYNSTTQNCEYCSVGTYGDSAGLTQCQSCGVGKTTLGIGSDASSACVGKYIVV